MAEYELLIRGGTVVDGTGAPAVRADVGVNDGAIAAVGDLAGADADEVIDAEGKYVTPGFFDGHTHYDAQLFWDPYCSNSGEHGTTTTALMNCGFGMAPVRPDDRERVMLMMENTEEISVSNMKLALPWDWETWSEMWQRIGDLPKGVNVTSFVPLNPIMLYVMGPDEVKTRRPTEAEIAEMRSLVGEAMDNGALGVSLSLIGPNNTHRDFDGTPMPSDIMEVDDAIAVCQELTDRGEGIIQILTATGPNGDRTASERMALETGRPTMHNAFLCISDEMCTDDLAWLDSVNERGGDMWALGLLYPGWVEGTLAEFNTAFGAQPEVNQLVLCESPEAVLELIASDGFRDGFRESYRPEIFPVPGGFDGLIVLKGDEAGDAVDPYVGRMLGEYAATEGVHVVDALLDAIVAADGHLLYRTFAFINPDPELGRRYWSHPRVLAGGSDGGAHVRSMSLGVWTTYFLINRVREMGQVPIEEMVYEMTSKATGAFGVVDRGSIVVGQAADLLVFDLDELYFDMSQYEQVHDMPDGDWRKLARAGGYDRIIVNGEVTHIADKPTGVTPGRALEPAEAAAS